MSLSVPSSFCPFPFLFHFSFSLSFNLFLLIFHSQSLSNNISISLSFLSSLNFSRFLFLSLFFFLPLLSSLFVFHSFIYHLTKNFGSLSNICFIIPSLALACFRTCRIGIFSSWPRPAKFRVRDFSIDWKWVVYAYLVISETRIQDKRTGWGKWPGHIITGWRQLRGGLSQKSRYEMGWGQRR